jgi:cyclophilin family peptidyl-prolyl cis-trans isomerase
MDHKLNASRVLCLGLVPVIIAMTLSGCGQHHPDAAHDSGSAESPKPNADSAPLDPRLHEPFADATTEPPSEWHRPPDTTLTQKSVGKLYTDVVRTWDDIHFVSPSGNRVAYRATLDTELGPIEIDLLPDLAPNHVRSFVALARAGYYDGLVFDRTVHQEVSGRPDARVEYIEAGCPLGTGEAGYGSIGYWLKPEFNSQAPHEEGAVGATHGEETDVSACKFYINLSKSADIDDNYTIFGKVTSGLSIARNILALPVRHDSEFPEGDRPVKTVVIRKVTIRTEEINPPKIQ